MPSSRALKDSVIKMQQKEVICWLDQDLSIRQNNEKMAIILTTSRILQQPRCLWINFIENQCKDIASLWVGAAVQVLQRRTKTAIW